MKEVEIMGIYSYLKKEYANGQSLWFPRFLLANYLSPQKGAVPTYRVAKYYADRNRSLLEKYFSRKLIRSVGCYISTKATIGSNFQLKHANGVVIGDGVEIGNNVKIYQQVTLGGKKVGDKEGNNYPIIEDNVTIFAGAKLVGGIRVGKNAVIGANSVVVKDIEPNTVYAGVPAKKIADNNE